MRRRIAQHAVEQPQHGFDHHHGRRLPARQHVVADRDFLDPHPPGRHPRRPAGRCPRSDRTRTPGASRSLQRCGGRLREQAHRPGSGQPKAFRVEHDFIQRFTPYRRLHHHPGTATVGCVVDRAVHVVRPAPQVVHVQIDQARLQSPCPATIVAADPGRPGRSLRRRFSPTTPRSSRPSGGSISTIPSSSDTDVTIALTNGTNTSRAAGVVDWHAAPPAAHRPRCAAPRRRRRRLGPSVVRTRRPSSWWS